MMIISGRASTSAVSNVTPACISSGTSDVSAFTTLFTICGMTFTIVLMICGRAETSDVRSFTPACINCGIIVVIAFVMLSIITGICASRTGRTDVKSTLKISGFASRTAICPMASIIISVIIGRFSRMLLPISVIICITDDRIKGAFSISVSPKTITMSTTELASVGRFSTIDVTMTGRSCFPIDAAFSMPDVIESITELKPSFKASSAPSSPTIRLVNPFIRFDNPGSIFDAIPFLIPLKAVLRSCRLSWKAAELFTASSERTPPSSCTRFRIASVSSADVFSNGPSSLTAFPRRS